MLSFKNCSLIKLIVILDLQKVRQQVVKEIKSNQQLEQDLDQMDIKIGLLIKNRITLQVLTTSLHFKTAKVAFEVIFEFFFFFFCLPVHIFL